MNILLRNKGEQKEISIILQKKINLEHTLTFDFAKYHRRLSHTRLYTFK
ncbi:hypothetical protein ES703_46651 [subsurface metagenome]